MSPIRIPGFILIAILISAELSLAQISESNKSGFESITSEEILNHISFLADDSLKGRPAGSDENLLAAMYIAKQFRSAGLTPLFDNKLMRGTKKDLNEVELNIENAELFENYFQSFNIQKSMLTDNNRFSLIKSVEGSTIELDYQYKSDFLINYKGMEDIKVSAPIVFAGYGIEEGLNGYNDFKDPAGELIDVKNKIVVIVDSYPQEENEDSEFSKADKKEFRMIKFKAVAAVKKGALGILVVQSPIVKTEPLNTKLNRISRAFELEYAKLHETKRRSIPLIYLSEKVSQELFENLHGESLQTILKKIDQSVRPQAFEFNDVSCSFNIDFEYEVLPTQNVIGYLEGSDPALKNEWLVIGAHYDHVGLGFYGAMDKSKRGQIHNGADDNASGTSGLLELAEAFSMNPSKRSILFAAFGAEENGLLGSRYYVNNFPVVPLESTVAMLNLDMISRNEPELLWIGGAFEGRDIINTVKEANHAVGFELLYNVGFFSKASDQAHFLKNEIPSIFFFAGLHDDYHTPSDDVDKINFDKAARVAKLAYLTGWILGTQDVNPNYENIPMPERAVIVKDSNERKKKFKE